MRLTLALALALALPACEDEARPSGQVVVVPGGDQMQSPGTQPPEVPPPPGTRADAGPTAPPVTPVALRITRPARAHRGFGDTVRVEGVLSGGEGPVLRVGDQRVVPLSDGQFAVDVPVQPGLNVIVTTVEDPTGPLEDRRTVLQDADVDPADPVEDGVGVHVGRAGFHAVAALLTDYLQDLDVAALVAANTPEGISIESLDYDRIEIALEPLDGFVGVRLRIYGLSAAIEGQVSFGVDFTVSGTASADPAEILAALSITPDGSGGLDIGIAAAEVNLRDFDYDIEWVPEFVESWFAERVTEFAEGLLEDALRQFVVPALFDASALRRSVEVLGVELEMGLSVEAVEIDPEGLTLSLDAEARADRAMRDGDAVPLLGGRPGYDKGAHLDVAAAADLVARLLHAAWAGGALDITLGEGGDVEMPVPLTTALLAAPLGEAAAGVDRMAPLRVRMRPLLPAEVRVEPGERPLVIEMGALMFDLETEADGVLVTLAVDLVAHTALDITGLDAVELGADVVVEVHADVAETPRGPVDAARLEGLFEGLAGAIPGLLASQTFAFGADALPVPVRFVDPRFEADARAAFVHVRADIAAP